MTAAGSSTPERAVLVTSRYNFAVPTVETAVVYNALHGSAVPFEEHHVRAEHIHVDERGITLHLTDDPLFGLCVLSRAVRDGGALATPSKLDRGHKCCVYLVQ